MHVVVIGGGLAGAHAVAELRALGHEGDITLVGDEPHRPYERPPLSKGVLLGTAEPEEAFVHPAGWYDEHGVALVLGTPVTGLDLARRHVLVGDRELAYDRLLLATGAAPRRLPGAPEGVHHLRTLDDAVALRDRLQGTVLVIGAGWIGLEVASAARTRGAEVHVVEMADLPLQHTLGSEVGAVLAAVHRRHGVHLHLGTALSSLEGSRESGYRARLSDGTTVAADEVVVGIGVLPRDELARAAGLADGNGVPVAADLRSRDPHVFAAGDVARHEHPLLGPVRVEHWDNAIEQGRHAARVMLGDDAPYERLPYFFSDQYDLGLEFLGHLGNGPVDTVVVRGDLDKPSLEALWVRSGRIVAGMHVDAWDSMDRLRELVGGPATKEALDPDVPLAEVG